MKKKKNLIKLLFFTGRPQAMLFAFVLNMLSFKIYGSFPILLVSITSTSFALITGNIMSFNDYIDRDNDCKKGKTFAKNYSSKLFRYIILNASIIIISLSLLFFINLELELFIFSIWIIGLLYSFIPKWYIFQNLVVAICSSSPILTAYIYKGEINKHILLIFIIFCGIIFIREILKDTEDKKIDIGYKKTIPNTLPEKTIYNIIIPIITLFIIIGLYLLFNKFLIVFSIYIYFFIRLTVEKNKVLQEKRKIFLVRLMKKNIDCLIVVILIAITFI